MKDIVLVGKCSLSPFRPGQTTIRGLTVVMFVTAKVYVLPRPNFICGFLMSGRAYIKCIGGAANHLLAYFPRLRT